VAAPPRQLGNSSQPVPGQALPPTRAASRLPGVRRSPHGPGGGAVAFGCDTKLQVEL